MRIEEHAFYVLGITARSSKREILGRVEALSIQIDPDTVSACRIQVTHPAKRLDAELSWFPGLAPARIRNIVTSIRNDSNLPATLGERFSGVDCLGAFNAIAYWLSAHDEVGAEQWDMALCQLSDNSLAIDAVELMATLNADRSVAGMPQITDLPSVESSLTRLRESTAASVAERLTRCPQHGFILARAIEREVEDGDSPVSPFMAGVVDRYQVLIQPALDQIGERLGARSEIVLLRAENLTLQRDAANAARLSGAIDDLREELSEWRIVARPIQLLMKSQGLKDSHSMEVARRVRSMSVRVANDFDMHEQAWQITNLLYEAFQDVPETAELLEKDLSILDEIIDSNHESIAPEEEQQGEFDFDVENSAPLEAPQAAPPPLSGSQAGDHDVSDSVAPVDAAGPPLPITETDLRLSEADTAKALEIFRAEGEEGLRKFLETLYANHSQAESRPTPSSSDGAVTARAFAQLCRSIRLECWQGVDAQDGHSEKNLSRFRAGEGAYHRQVSPWLAIICDTHRGDTPMVMQVRNAAAECLSSLAGGFICVGDFVSAQRLCMEALPIVFDDKKLESEITSQLDFIASEKQKVPKQSSRPAQKSAASPAPDTPAAGSRRARPQTGASSLFSSIKNSPSRTRLVLVGIAALIGVALLFLSVTGPQWQPQVKGTGPTGQESTSVAPPPSPPHDPVSLPNGTTLMRPLRTSGQGTLKISNFTDHDAAVKLKILNGRTIRFVYVRGMGNVTISKIPPGEYSVQFASGRDWDETTLVFREDQSFAAFDEALSFSDDGRFYSVYEITLHTVPNGNIRKRAISAEEFSDNLVAGGNEGK